MLTGDLTDGNLLGLQGRLCSFEGEIHYIRTRRTPSHIKGRGLFRNPALSLAYKSLISTGAVRRMDCPSTVSPLSSTSMESTVRAPDYVRGTVLLCQGDYVRGTVLCQGDGSFDNFSLYLCIGDSFVFSLH